MADGVVKGEGWAAAPDLDAMGGGYGFRKLLRELDVTEFGVNVISWGLAYQLRATAYFLLMTDTLPPISEQEPVTAA